uniref:Solute carrier family 26 member 8 n=1 Tax=Coturnix japonica TaxID=93934 RepID=A0A8C2Y6N1_COTJA
MLSRFPVLNWLFSYQFREWILKDLHAGLNVGLVQVPQGLLGIWLSGLPLPAINGFLSAFCCSMLYVVFGSSHHISIGKVFVAVKSHALQIWKQERQVRHRQLHHTSLLICSIQLLLGCFCLKSVTAYLPKALIDAYLSAAALLVIVSQFTFIFDVVLDFHKGSRDIFCNIFYFFLALPKSNATSILLFLLSVGILNISKTIRITYLRSPVAFPMELLLIITATITANCTHLHAESSSTVVSMIPQRYLPPALPDLSNMSKIILHAFSLAVVSCFLLVFIGEKYALLHNYSISSCQELIAVGLCNICSAFFRSFAVSCAVSGTVIQEKTGGRTQIAALIGASIMLVIALKLGRFFQVIPNSVLAAVVVFNMLPFLEKFLDIPTLWRKDKYHLAIWIGTFAAVLRLGLDVGLLIALAIAFFIISIRSHRGLGEEKLLLQSTALTDPTFVLKAMEIDGIKIFQCCSSISFANMSNFKSYLFIIPVLKLFFGGMLLLGAANAQSASSGITTQLQPEKNEDEGQQAGVSPGSAEGNTSAQLDGEEQPVLLPGPVHTIILDFSMVQFVDLQGSDLLRQIFYMFLNVGITVLIAGCHCEYRICLLILTYLWG